MIEIRPRKFLNFADFSRAIPGRDDDPALVEVCWDYLSDVHTGEHKIAKWEPGDPKKVRALLAAELVRQSSTGSREHLKVIAAQRATIDRLLAFVPTRAQAVSSERINFIVQQLLRRAEQAFAGKAISVTTHEEEKDQDTEACHRVSISVKLGEHLADDAVVAGIAAVHRELAAVASTDEIRAIRLVVEPDGAADRES